MVGLGELLLSDESTVNAELGLFRRIDESLGSMVQERTEAARNAE